MTATMHSRVYEEPDTEYHECRTCGIRLGTTPQDSESGQCRACKSATTRPQSDSQYGFTIPGFDITIFRSREGTKGTTKTINAFRTARLAYWTQSVIGDPVTYAYVVELFDALPTYCVTISEPGRLLDHWAGYRPDKIAEWVTRATTHELAA